MKGNACKLFYIGETENLRKRMNNAKSDVRNPLTAPVPYASHLNKCSKLNEPYFTCYPINENDMFWKFKEWRFIKRFKPKFNFKL